MTPPDRAAPVSRERRPREIRFYFDYISSNAYLAWKRLPAIARAHGARIEPVPVLFAGLLEAHGQLGPAEVRAKALWMWKENLREAALLGVPLRSPRHHPFNPLLALRVSSLPLATEQREALMSALFDAVWVRELHVSEPEVVRGIAQELALDAPDVVAAAQMPESKQRLRRQTQAALAAGAFGVPSMIVDDELFWGYDDLGFLDLYLAGKDPIDARALTQQTGFVSPSAMRRGVKSWKDQ